MRNEIICDKCKLIISKFEIKTHIITKDEKGIDVQESYFQCPTCGKKYTILISDRKVALTDSEACSVPEENPEGKEQKR